MKTNNEQNDSISQHYEPNVADHLAEELFVLDDLLLATETEDQVKGGPGAGWCTTCAVIYSNHNETLVNEADDEAEAQTAVFDDLPVTDQQEERIKGGSKISKVDAIEIKQP